jgi:hypothetical protein
VAASATTAYLAAHLSPRSLVGGKPSFSLVRAAQVHGYTTAFWWASAIFCVGAVVAAVLFRWGPLATAGQPVAAESVDAGAQGSPEPGAVPG